MSCQSHKTIKLNETFESYDEFTRVFEEYSNNTYQKFVKKDSSHLYAKDIKNKELGDELAKRFVLKRATYQCIHSGNARANENRRGLRKTHTKKIGCTVMFKINFCEKRLLFEISQFVDQHNHLISKEIFEQYSNKRKRKSQVQSFNNDSESSSSSSNEADFGTNQNENDIAEINPSFDLNNATNLMPIVENNEGSLKQNSIKALEAKINAATKELQSNSTSIENTKYVIELCEIIKVASEAIAALQRIK